MKLVQEFDRMCDEVVNRFADACTQYNVQDDTVMVPRHIKIAVPRSEEEAVS